MCGRAKKDNGVRFHDEIKNYLSGLAIEELELSEAELYGMLQSGMSLKIKGGGSIGLSVSTEYAYAARRLFKLIRQVFGRNAVILQAKSLTFGERISYRVEIEDSALAKEILRYYSLNFPENRQISDDINPSNEEICRSYLRGVFIVCGYCADPVKSYRLEFNLSSKEYAQSLRELLDSLDLRFHLREKNNTYSLVSNNAQTLSTFLALIGANEHYLKIEDKIAMKDMKNTLQRTVNCETANISKTVETAVNQIKAIEKIMDKGKFASLPEHLIKTANLRLDNPQSSLSELAASAGEISRSTLDKRLRRLVDIAKNL